MFFLAPNANVLEFQEEYLGLTEELVPIFLANNDGR